MAAIRPAPVGYRRPKLVSASQGNDDVVMECYHPAPFLFAGKQRKGSREAFEGRRDIADHGTRAMGGIPPGAGHSPSG